MTTRSLRVLEGNARWYRRTWRGSVISTFLNPVLFLLAMGIGLGSLVDSGPRSSDLGVEYLVFLAPGLLAATAMQTGASDSSWPVMAAIKWRKTYDAILATPLRVTDIVVGHIGWVIVRLSLVTTVYALVVVAFGAAEPWAAAAAIPAAILTGAAHTSPTMAFTAKLKHESGLSALFRFGILPLFLFSGTFFPISQLPGWLEWVAFVVPLFHGVSLTRGIATDLPFEIDPVFSVVYLLAWLVGGTLLAIRLLRNRLVI